MMFFKSVLSLSALLAVASAMSVKQTGVHSDMSIIGGVDGMTEVFATAGSDCDKESEKDCSDFCSLSEQTAKCSANGNKVTCYCKGGKSGESDCEARCLLCMPGASALEEAKRAFGL